MAVKLMLEVARSDSGQLQGFAWPEHGGPIREFAGILELLKVLEDLGLPAPAPASAPTAPPVVRPPADPDVRS